MSEDNTAKDQVANCETISCRPFLKWAGGKGQLLAELLARVPSGFNHYFEPFLGGGALFFALQPQRAVLSDLNSELIKAFVAVKNSPTELVNDLKQHHYESDYFYSVRNIDRSPYLDRLTDVQRASRLIFLNKCCYNGLYRVNSKGQFNTPFGKYTNPTICDPENILACSAALARAELVCVDYKIATASAQSDDFIYFDPPYMPVSSTSNFTAYAAGGFGLKEQQELAAYCTELTHRGVKFLLSNSDTEVIKELYKNFSIESVKASRSVNSKASRRGQVSELMIKNY